MPTTTNTAFNAIVIVVLDQLRIPFLPGFGGRGFHAIADGDARRIRFVEREVNHMLGNLSLLDDDEPPERIT